jgi:hypothetical protein
MIWTRSEAFPLRPGCVLELDWVDDKTFFPKKLSRHAKSELKYIAGSHCGY